MESSRFWLRRAAIALFAALASVGLAVVPVAAAPAAAAVEVAPPDEFDDLPDSADLVKEGGSEQVQISPSGCKGTTDNPHRSSHVRGTINVVGRTECASVLEKIRVKTTLQRSRFWGWEEQGEGVSSTTIEYFTETNAASPKCVGDTHNWRGLSTHTSWEPTGTYVGSTKNQQDNITC